MTEAKKQWVKPAIRKIEPTPELLAILLSSVSDERAVSHNVMPSRKVARQS